jgi:hypothetical protein
VKTLDAIKARLREILSDPAHADTDEIAALHDVARALRQRDVRDMEAPPGASSVDTPGGVSTKTPAGVSEGTPPGVPSLDDVHAAEARWVDQLPWRGSQLDRKIWG